jgi:hypothetical protein
VVEAFRSLPWLVQLAAVALVAALGIALVVMALEPRGRRTDQRTRHRDQNDKRAASAAKRMGPHERHMGPHEQHMDDPDKPPYQPPTPGLPPTAGQPAVRKLPGQDRLTRDPRTGMDAVPERAADHLSGGGSPSERSDPAVPAAEPPPLRSTDPPLAPGQPPPFRRHEATDDSGWPVLRLRADDPPLGSALPGTAEMPLVRPPVPPAPFPPPPNGETRAQRRRRLEALIDREAAERRRPEA